MIKNFELIIVNELIEHLSPFLIYLFGSTINGNTHAKSDIDIAFYSNQSSLDSYELFMIAQKVASKLN
ncbi:nucleotidyltransferase domain-containing protein [Salipaludibacillus sp. HK11]|uniref:nucleotidyltransferase domain-containing protein n=1 Tax=Salipaludibacillus sp. HK11 TaxID=3394320 RepID=UPI0039FBEB07